MALDQCDPRVFFAAERTLLAWLRTGLTIIAIGFLISRFGLFVQFLSAQTPSVTHHANVTIPATLGIIFVIIGSVAIASAAIQHKRFVATLSATSLPSAYSGQLAFILSMLTAVLGMALAAYLWLA
jgi:inner membrane protein YidH